MSYPCLFFTESFGEVHERQVLIPPPSTHMHTDTHCLHLILILILIFLFLMFCTHSFYCFKLFRSGEYQQLHTLYIVFYKNVLINCLFHHFVDMIKQFLRDTFWGRMFALVIDTPPGTSDEHLSGISRHLVSFKAYISSSTL